MSLLMTDELKTIGIIENLCECGNMPQPLHPCPYEEDINQDSETLCWCCKDCEEQCAMDI